VNFVSLLLVFVPDLHSSEVSNLLFNGGPETMFAVKWWVKVPKASEQNGIGVWEGFG